MKISKKFLAEYKFFPLYKSEEPFPTYARFFDEIRIVITFDHRTGKMFAMQPTEYLYFEIKKTGNVPFMPKEDLLAPLNLVAVLTSDDFTGAYHLFEDNYIDPRINTGTVWPWEQFGTKPGTRMIYKTMTMLEPEIVLIQKVAGKTVTFLSAAGHKKNATINSVETNPFSQIPLRP